MAPPGWLARRTRARRPSRRRWLSAIYASDRPRHPRVQTAVMPHRHVVARAQPRGAAPMPTPEGRTPKRQAAATIVAAAWRLCVRLAPGRTSGAAALLRDLNHAFHRRVDRAEIGERAGRYIGYTEVVAGLDQPRLEWLGGERPCCDDRVFRLVVVDPGDGRAGLDRALGREERVDEDVDLVCAERLGYQRIWPTEVRLHSEDIIRRVARLPQVARGTGVGMRRRGERRAVRAVGDILPLAAAIRAVGRAEALLLAHHEDTRERLTNVMAGGVQHRLAAAVELGAPGLHHQYTAIGEVFPRRDPGGFLIGADRAHLLVIRP